MKTCLGSCLCAALLLAGPVLAADSPWIGTWKVDPARTNAPGISFSKLPSGLTRYSSLMSSEVDIAFDGKEYTASKVTAYIEETLAADGRSFTAVRWAGKARS
jgi:hypothetical protein